jgi:hypothetical protein
MCLLIVHHDLPSERLGRKRFFRAANANPDGVGFAWTLDGELFTERYMDAGEAFHAYCAAASTADGPAMLHFRYATSGKTDTTNVHPFVLDSGIAFAHNGVLGDGTREHSDTRHFAELALWGRDPDWFFDPRTEQQLCEWIGWNKLAFLAADGRYAIVGEEFGEWRGGTWFSNASAFTPRVMIGWHRVDDDVDDDDGVLNYIDDERWPLGAFED